MRWTALFLLLFACDDKAPDSEAPADDSAPIDDADGDGSPVSEDCNDQDPAVFPGASEVCDDQDNDCDSAVDEDATDAATWYADGDGDGYGTEPTLSCSQPEGYAPLGEDCDDGDPRFNPGAAETDCADPNDYNCDGSTGYTDNDQDGYAACQECDDSASEVHPGVDEICDNIDNNCDGRIDEAEAIDATTWYADVDGDGHGDAGAAITACTQPEGSAALPDDCDDSSAEVSPTAVEVCDGIDNNCDTFIDENVSTMWYQDSDGDGFGDPSTGVLACEMPSGYSADGTDCDDTVAEINPSATELCDSVDNDCDNTIDEPDAADAQTWYADGDSDTYGDPNQAIPACSRPAGYRGNSRDCDDLDSSINPAATEYCDSLDNDCDGDVDEDDAADATIWYADLDADGYGDGDNVLTACAQPSGAVSDDSDCDDNDASQGPCGSCLQILLGGQSTGDGVYTFDACGTGDADYWCDMTTDGGGWTLAGWQAANATTWLGTSDWGTVGDSAWSKDLACIQFEDIVVFNQTYAEYFVQSYTSSTWSYTGASNFDIGPVGTAFKQGTYGPAGTVMGCVDYAYGSLMQTHWACDNDWSAGQKGHIADYAGEFCSGGRLDNTWAWTNGTSCAYRGVQYTWGFGVR